MRKIVFITIQAFVLISLRAQTTNPGLPVQETKVLDVAYQMPVLEGGEQALNIFVFENIRYPALARENGIQGKVVAQFVVDVNGRMRDFTIVQSVGGGCDEEVLRILTLLNSQKKWIPGKQDSADVPVRYTLPVSFILPQSSGKTKQSKKIRQKQ